MRRSPSLYESTSQRIHDFSASLTGSIKQGAYSGFVSVETGAASLRSTGTAPRLWRVKRRQLLSEQRVKGWRWRSGKSSDVLRRRQGCFWLIHEAS